MLNTVSTVDPSVDLMPEPYRTADYLDNAVDSGVHPVLCGAWSNATTEHGAAGGCRGRCSEEEATESVKVTIV